MIQCQLVVATAIEARPLIDYFHLKPVPTHPFRQYANDTLSLVESGIGKMNAAAATAAVLTCHGITQQGVIPACLNIGIAGSDLPVGEIRAGHLVRDEQSGKNWYPQLTWKPPCETVSLVTVDAPSDAYTDTEALDMEVSGFVSAATLFTTMEFVQSLKVISDNPNLPVDQVNFKESGDLIAEQLPVINQSINNLVSLHSVLPDTSAVTTLLNTLHKKMHITSSQKDNLKRLLTRLTATGQSLPSLEWLNTQKNVKSVIRELGQQLDNHEIQY